MATSISPVIQPHAAAAQAVGAQALKPHLPPVNTAMAGALAKAGDPGGTAVEMSPKDEFFQRGGENRLNAPKARLDQRRLGTPAKQPKTNEARRSKSKNVSEREDSDRHPVEEVQQAFGQDGSADDRAKFDEDLKRKTPHAELQFDTYFRAHHEVDESGQDEEVKARTKAAIGMAIDKMWDEDPETLRDVVQHTHATVAALGKVPRRDGTVAPAEDYRFMAGPKQSKEVKPLSPLSLAMYIDNGWGPEAFKVIAQNFYKRMASGL